MFNIFYPYLLIFVTSLTGIWKGIPVGIALQVEPLHIGIATALGGVISALILFFAGEKVRLWFEKRMGEEKLNKNKNRFGNWLNKYGVVGLGLLAPGPLGQIVPVILGLVMVNNIKRFAVYHCIGTVIWSIVLAYFFNYIVAFVQHIF